MLTLERLLRRFSNDFSVIVWRALVAIGIGFFSAAILFPAVSPISFPVEIEITALGERNPSSASKEVWVQIENGANKGITSSLVPGDNDWYQKDGWWVTNSDVPSKIHYKGATRENLTLLLVSHAWSGKAAIKVNGQSEEIDLYSPTNSIKKRKMYSLPVWAKIVAFAIGAVFGLKAARYIRVASNALLPWARTYWALIFILLVLGIVIGVVWPFEQVIYYWETKAWLSLWLSLFGAAASLLTAVLRAAEFRGLAAVPATRKDCAAASFLVFCSGCVSLAAFYPGLMSADSIAAWKQIATRSPIVDFPAMHTIYMYALSGADNPGFVAFFQVVMLSSVVYLICNTARLHGIPRVAVWISGLLLSLSPVVMVTIVTHWRDVPYSLTIVFSTWLVMLTLQRQGEVINRYWYLLCLGVCLGLAALFRFNGFLVMLGLIPILMAGFKKKFLKLLLTLTIAAGLFFSVKAFLYPALNVVPSALLNYAIAHHVGAHLKSGSYISPGDAEFLEKVRHIDSSAWQYDCTCVNSSIYTTDYKKEFAQENVSRYAKIAIKLALTNPMVELQHQICASDFVWRVPRFSDKFYKYVFAISQRSERLHYIDDNPFVKEQSFLPPDSMQVLQKTLVSIESPFLVRPALYLYALLLAFAISGLRLGSYRHGIVLAPVLLSSFSLLLLSVAQDVRYQYAVFITALLFVPIFLFWPADERHWDG